MINKLDEEYFGYQTKLNLSEIYNNEEIKLLRESIPDLNNLIYLVSNNDFNNNSKFFNEIGSQYQYRYFSPSRKIKNNSNTCFLIDKEKFFSLILDTTKNFFEKEKKFLLSKSISLLINEILNISKIIKQNLIYKQFFKDIKNSKLISHSTQKDKTYKNIKVRFNIKETNRQNNNFRNTNTKNFLQNYPDETDINNITNVKKQLSFSENKLQTNKNNKFNKSVIKEKINKDTSNIKKKKNLSTNINSSIIKTKKKIISQNAINIFKRNINSLHNSSAQIKNIKQPYQTFLIGQSKISLKKNIYENKKLGINDILNNKNEFFFYDNQNIKNNSKNREYKSQDKKDIKKNIHLKKITSPKEIDSNLYNNIETQEFNIFKLESKIGREPILALIGYYVFNCFGFDEIIKYNKFENWCQKISEGYVRKNYYHNDLHAADITQTCLLYFKLGEFETVHKFNKPQICSIFLSCICHDYRHPGVNNNYLKETSNKIAIRYNDISILESMHISATFKLILNNKEYNIFEGLDNKLYSQMRKEMISCVLATDMAFHNQYVEFLKQCINNNGFLKIEDKDKNEINQKYMNLLIHSSDISNPTKLFNIYFEWAKLVVEEFWAQGDKEKKLHLKCSCDREKVSIYQSQLGFINFIEIPYFSLFSEVAPKLKFFYDNLLNNKNKLLSMQEEEKSKANNMKK